MKLRSDLLKRILENEERTRSLEISGSDFKALCEVTMNYLVPFVDRVGDAPAFPEASPAPVSSELDIECGEDRHGAIRKLIETQLKGGIETASGGFMGYIPGGGIVSCAIADLVVAVTNRYSGLNFAAPGAAETENEVVLWLSKLCGMGPTAWGALTSGGSMATMNALLAARETVKELPFEKLTIYVSEQMHHVNIRALKILGFERAIFRQIKLDDQLRMMPSDLECQINKDVSTGLIPFLVIATAGTTNSGQVDPLSEISKLTVRHNMWLHVDAAYGGFFLLTSRGRSLMKGIEKANSIVLDPHKGMFLSYGVGAFLVSDHHILRSALNADAAYLHNDDNLEIRSPADYSIELTRHNRAPRIKLSLDIFGEEAFTSSLDEKLDLAKWLYSELSEIVELDLMNEPQLSIVAFRAKLQGQTQDLLSHLLSNGDIHVSSTQIDGKQWIRVCILSFRTHLRHVEKLKNQVQSYFS